MAVAADKPNRFRAWWLRNICGPVEPGYYSTLDRLDGLTTRSTAERTQP